MLVAIGPGVKNLQDYTGIADFKKLSVTGNQGDTLDTLKLRLHDPLAQLTLTAEDDIIILNEADPNGWPTTNLIVNGDMEGTYSGGMPPNWSGNGSYTAAGVAFSANTGTAPAPMFGSSSLAMSGTNVAASTTFGVIQKITLPTDENGAVLRAQPYFLSFWFYYTSGMVGVASHQLGCSWLDANSNYISSVSTFPYVNPNGSGEARWDYAYTSGYAPANAVYANIYLNVNMASNAPATNSFSLIVDGVQFEYATFAGYRTLMPDPNLINPNMQSHSGSGASFVDRWGPSDTSGNATYSVVTSPSIHGTAQQVTIKTTAAANSGYGVNQGYKDIPITRGGTYTASLKYQITSALPAGSFVQLLIAYFDSAGAYHGGPTVNGPAGQGVTGVWNTLTTPFGASTSNAVPQGSGQMYLRVQAQIVTAGSGTPGGAVAFGEITVTTAGAMQSSLAEVNAVVAGIYPTDFCDASQPGTYTDTGESGLIYRHARLFGGYVRKLTSNYTAGPEREYDIDATEYGVMLAEAPANLVIRQISDVSAIQQVCQYAVNQGFLRGLDYTTFVTGIGQVYAMAFSWITTRDALTRIANQTVAAYWVDPYKRLHYQPALAVNAPFALSDQPDYVKTFPFSQFELDTDSTQSISTPIIEGSTQLSSPATDTFTGTAVALTAAVNANTNYTSLSVGALPRALPINTVVQVGAAAGSSRTYLTAAAAAGATTLQVNSFSSSATIAINDTVATCGWVVNTGNEIVQVDSCTVGGVAKTVGLASTNQYSQGYDALVDPQPALVTFNTPQTDAQAVAITYRYNAPVMVRLYAPRAVSTTLRRRIHRHTVQQEINSVHSAIDRANADLTTGQKARPIGKLRVVYPPCPTTTLLSQGQAIAITHRTEKLNGTLFQIQRVTTTVGGNGYLRQDLEVGFYRPDFMIRMAHANREIDLAQASQLDAGTILSDVLASADGWALTDSIQAVVNNVGTWGSSTHATPSTWGGTYVWT